MSMLMQTYSMWWCMVVVWMRNSILTKNCLFEWFRCRWQISTDSEAKGQKLRQMVFWFRFSGNFVCGCGVTPTGLFSIGACLKFTSIFNINGWYWKRNVCLVGHSVTIQKFCITVLIVYQTFKAMWHAEWNVNIKMRTFTAYIQCCKIKRVLNYRHNSSIYYGRNNFTLSRHKLVKGHVIFTNTHTWTVANVR